MTGKMYLGLGNCTQCTLLYYNIIDKLANIF